MVCSLLMLRAQFIGNLTWQCPECLCIQKDTLTPRGGFKVQCRHKGCQAHYVLGVAFGKNGPGFKLPPGDCVMIDTGLWAGGRVNRLFCESCSVLLFDHTGKPCEPAQVLETA